MVVIHQTQQFIDPKGPKIAVDGHVEELVNNNKESYTDRVLSINTAPNKQTLHQ